MNPITNPISPKLTISPKFSVGTLPRIATVIGIILDSMSIPPIANSVSLDTILRIHRVKIASSGFQVMLKSERAEKHVNEINA